jgi:hypothetical protein
MKSKLVILIIAAATAKALVGQNPNTDYKFGIKIYNLARYEPTREIHQTNPVGLNYIVETKDQFRLLHPTVALQRQTKRKNFHEVEITDLKWQNVQTKREMLNDSIKSGVLLNGENTTETAFAARYEFILVLCKKKEGRLVPSIGFAGSPYYNSFKTMPVLSYSFPSLEQHMGLKAFVTPRLTLYTKKKIYFDLNLPLCVASAEFLKKHTDDPSVPAVEKNVSTLDMATFQKMFSARVGIGIKI